MTSFNYSIFSLFFFLWLPVFLSANNCSTSTAVSTGSCASLNFDASCDFGPLSQVGCSGCIGDSWFQWSSGGGSNLTQYNMRFNIELDAAGTVNIILAYSESIDASGNPCIWSSGSEGYTRYQTQCAISLSGPGDVYPFDNEGLDGSGTFFIIVEKVSGAATQVTFCPELLSTCAPPANDRCSNATALTIGNGIDPASVSGPSVAIWSDAMKGTISCATKQRLQATCNSQTEDHYARNAFTICFHNGNVGDNPLAGSLLGAGQCDEYLENTVWYSFNVPVTANDWFLHIASSAQCSQEPNQIVAMLFSSVNCTNAQTTSPNRITCSKFGLYGAVPTPDYSYPASVGMSLDASITYYLVIDGTRGSQCDFCILLVRGPSDPVLPADLNDFRGRNQGKENILFWSTNKEDRHNYFEVEKSTDGENFSPIGQVAGNGSLSETSNYTFSDPHAPIGKSYYRLNMVDLNGMSFHSQTIEITREVSSFLLHELYPNPAYGELRIHFSTPISLPVEISLWDLRGKVVRNLSQPVTAGEHVMKYSTDNISPGIYLLKIRQGMFTEVRKVVVK